MQDRLAAWRRVLHQIPEVGMDLPNTLAYVKDRLNEMGVGSAQAGRCGLYALLGQGTTPSCSVPHAELRYLYFSSSNCPYNIVPLLPFRYPMKPDTAIFGGISSNMWIWSAHTSASTIPTPFHSHNCLSIFPIASRFFAKILS